VTEKRYDAVVFGGGSAGLAAAARIASEGFSVAVLEREQELGGVLNQCIHSGFGLHVFREDLTGPEYAERFIERVRGASGLDVYLDTTAQEVTAGGGSSPEAIVVYGYSHRYGILRLAARAAVLAMGCRERNRGNIGIPGSRPAGVFTAGLAQRLINIDGYLPGKRAVIVGSGDIGLIMARRLTWSGAQVLGVVEIQSYPSGLTRNIVQCLNDFGIPLHLSHVVSRIIGRDRVEAVEVSPVRDGVAQLQEGFRLDCDTVLLSVGLVPDNELSKKFGVALNPETGGPLVDAGLQTTVQGVFACGNVLHVHDLVDYVTEESERCAAFVAEYLRGQYERKQYRMQPGANVKYAVPNRYFPDRENRFYLRPLIVANQARLTVRLDGEKVLERRLAHVQPSEMLSFTIRPKELAGVVPSRENTLEVSVS
jgi:NADPH-dependent 2,4-dienoyl-CoA reductase/sulfur reductase-like enzyme